MCPYIWEPVKKLAGAGVRPPPGRKRCCESCCSCDVHGWLPEMLLAECCCTPAFHLLNHAQKP